MSTQPDETPRPPSQARWAKPVGRLSASSVPEGAMNLNVAGRQLTGPLKGFGQMWQKTYTVRLSGAQVRPADVVKTWKERFATFWPKGNRFYGSLTGIAPGEVAVLNLAGPGGVTGPGGTPVISTGIMVIYADDVSFSFMTPEGHILAGMITFSAHDDAGCTVAQVQALLRANDPLYELAFRMGIGHKTEDDFWQHTLQSLSGHFGVHGQVEQRSTLVDPRVQWSEARNIWYNAGIRTGLYLAATPLRWVGRLFKR